jgi:hypothetical protein
MVITVLTWSGAALGLAVLLLMAMSGAVVDASLEEAHRIRARADRRRGGPARAVLATRG